jgi:putative heme-binding domain-containing protein
VPVLLKLLDTQPDPQLQSTALAALQSYDDEEIAVGVLERFATLPDDVRLVAQTLLVSRKQWTRMLLEAIDSGKIQPGSISTDTVRKMTLHHDQRIAALIARHFHDIKGATNAQMQQDISRMAKLLATDAGDPYQGKVFFTAQCAKCHLMFNEGGRIGPDLTQYPRDDVERMLLHVVNPNAEIREGFETYTVLTNEGRVVSGFLYDQDKHVVVIRGADGQNITIARNTIEEMQKQPRSLMPEGLLDKSSDQEIRDLFAFLRSSQPVTK